MFFSGEVNQMEREMYGAYKVGRTNNLRRRWLEWRRQCPSQHQQWIFAYKTRWAHKLGASVTRFTACELMSALRMPGPCGARFRVR